MAAVRQKKIPMRMCLACREMKPKRDMLRVVRTTEGNITIDSHGKAPGRGAYVCHNRECLEKAVNGKILERCFGCKIGTEVYDELARQLSEAEREE